MSISSPQEIIEDIRLGKMVILMDDEDRENEGDLIIAASHITPEAINFMATHGRGLICLTLTKSRCRQLGLKPMVVDNHAPYSTNFTVSIEAAHGVTTGISASDRAKTVADAVALDAKPSDIVMPGHIFPLEAQDGGVLTRAGHTEAGCDLARLAGLEPAAVIVEILNEDGSMARKPQLEVFAKKHGIKLGTVADLIEYRNNTETTIQKVANAQLPTEYGEFELITYQDTIDKRLHYALIKASALPTEQPPLVRVHLKDTFSDLFKSSLTSAPNQWPLEKAMARIASEGGILVVLNNNQSPDYMIDKINAMQKAQEDQLRVTGAKKCKRSRRVGVGSQILADLGVSKMRLLSSSDKKYSALSGFGLEVVEYVFD